MLNATIKVGRQEVNVSARRTDGGFRIAVTPDDGPVNRYQLLAAAQRWCDHTIDAVPSATAHAHIEEDQIVISVVNPRYARERIEARLDMLPGALQTAGKTLEDLRLLASTV